MTSLVIVESPAKAKTISRFLGKDYIVEASFGHIRDLPENAEQIPESVKGEKWARFGVNLDSNFEPVYVVPESKKKQVAKLRQALKNADELLLATDEDREGESISWHLLEVLKPKCPVKRIVFHEITPEAIRDALDNARDVDTRLVNAQESRRIVDRLYGYSLSPVLWKKVQSGLSAGRVQSVAVRLLVEREEERRAFVSSEYWDLEAQFRAGSGGFAATLSSLDGKRIATGRDFDASTGKLKNAKVEHLDGKSAKDLAKDAEGSLPWTVSKVEGKPGKQRPAPPFTTSTLQQEANRKMGFTADRTMRIAQKLYEGVDLGDGERIGLITYMRTDSVTLAERALGEAQREIENMYGKDYAQGPRRYRTKSRNAQEAHEAIRPTQFGRRPQDIERYLSKEEARVYELIWKRTLASQMPEADVLRTTIEITAPCRRGPAVFSVSGKKILFPGYLRAYVEGSDDPAAELGDKETILPDLREGQTIGREPGPATFGDVKANQHVTMPPARYTEAALVKKLEEEGIGRPSTYASIITTIQNRGYANSAKSGGALVPTFTAMAVTNLMRSHFADYVDLKFTARMEEELDEIADGARDWVDHVRQFYYGASGATAADSTGLASRIEREVERIGFPDTALGEDPETAEPIVLRIGRYGPYLVRGEGGDGNRANVPPDIAPADLTVEDAAQMIRRKAEGPRAVGTDPKSGLTVYAARGRFGPYVQLGETGDSKEKPRRASLEKDMAEDDVDLETALHLLSLPRELGTHPETGTPILANNGRYGPYVQMDRDFRSIKEPDSPYTITLERALELLAQPKQGRRAAAKKAVLKDLGESIQVLDGRYGPYVTDGDTNATLPKDTAPESITLEQAKELIAAKAKSGGGRKKAAKKAVKKSVKKAAKKSSAKKAAKKKAK